jgi:predicted metal-dependent hydrolase
MTIRTMPADVEVKLHPRARRMTLRFQPRKQVFVVTKPKRTSQKDIAEFVSAHIDWMKEQRTLYPKPGELRPGETLLFLGKNLILMHVEAAGVACKIEDDRLIVACRLPRFERAVQRFLKQQAEVMMTALVHEKASAINKKIKTIRFRDTTSRWGSCARDGRLSFSWRIIMAPIETVDYIVAHEVAHLQHFNHSDRFWDLCERLSKDYETGKKWLQKNAELLQLAF